MGECRDCAYWRGPLYDCSEIGVCELLTQGHLGTAPAWVSGERAEAITLPDFGCTAYEAKPAAPDWQALAERRGAALSNLLEVLEPRCRTADGETGQLVALALHFSGADVGRLLSTLRDAATARDAASESH